MLTKRTAVLVTFAVLSVVSGLRPGGTVHAASDEVKLKGFVANVPGGHLSLPLEPGAAAVTITLQFGVPVVDVPVRVTPSTVIVPAAATPVPVTNGDRLEVEATVVTGVLQ